jgi:hypothetical protein
MALLLCFATLAGTTYAWFTFNINQFLSPNSSTSDFEVSIKMREDAGNVYQGMKLGNVSISVVATQASYENDSYDSSYDSNAVYPYQFYPVNQVVSNTAAVTEDDKTVVVLTAATSTDQAKDFVKVTVPASALADGVSELTVTATPVSGSASGITVNSGYTAISYDISVTGLKEGNTDPICIFY